jgi:predicted ester cyclase
MEQHEADALVRAIFRDVIDGRDYDRYDDLFDPAFVDHSPFGEMHGKHGFLAFLMPLHEAFPRDLHHEIGDVLLLTDDLAVWNVHATGIFDGSFMGIPGQGQRLDLHAANAGRMRAGRAVEHWALGPIGLAAMLAQMGIDPAVLAGAGAAA